MSDEIVLEPGVSKMITARGTEDGLVLRIDGRFAWSEILTEVQSFIGERRRFFEGGRVSIEWLDRMPTKEQSSSLEVALKNSYDIEVIRRRRRSVDEGLSPDSVMRSDSPLDKVLVEEEDDCFSNMAGAPRPDSGRKVLVPLFEGDEVVPSLRYESARRNEYRHDQRAAYSSALTAGQREEGLDAFAITGLREGAKDGFLNANGSDIGMHFSEDGFETTRTLGAGYAASVAKILGDELMFEEDANAKVVFGTLRSGQRVETPYSLVVIGDVNPGADLVAGGDIFVIGSLRGTAHASAYDDEFQDRVIIALQMRPMQLRIGSVISRGSDECVNGVEIAHIEDRRIVVEAYSAKSLARRKPIR